VKLERTRKLNNLEYVAGPIIYWMNREMRINDNWSFLYAQEKAREHGTYVVVVYNLVTNFLGGGLRQLQFKIEGLENTTKTAEKYNVPFFIVSDTTGKETPELVLEFLGQIGAGMLITDFSPLRISRNWVEVIRKKISVPMYGVDAHNIVPCWMVSTKQEFGAHTFRPKVYKLLSNFLEDFPVITKQKIPESFSIKSKSIVDTSNLDWKKFAATFSVDVTVPPVTWITGGETNAKKVLNTFLKNTLPLYAVKRNNPNEHAQSDLSPYLHYGQIAPQRVVLEVVNAVGLSIEKLLHERKNSAGSQSKNNTTLRESASAYLEELVVRRELSDNFCFYNENYDSSKGFPEWAKKTHMKHKDDARTYIYTKAQFEKAKTHDELWNAAQMEMVTRGKMHGYMRMYWAKKILEWTTTVDDAMKIAIYLNDKYQLDGRDPNGYTGIAWSLGGVHDRAWFERPVFGQIRYMNANGCKNKFDVVAYVKKWLRE